MKPGSTAPPNDLLREGLRLFNAREFFQCHEILETLWNQQSDPERQFTQGVIQIAVGLYHAQHGNFVGAAKLLPRGLARISPFIPIYRYIELGPFVVKVEACISKVESSIALQPDDLPVFAQD